MVKTAATSGRGTANSCDMGSMINRKIVKSKESSVQPSQAAIQARHWSLVGSFHHGTGVAPATAIAIAHPSCSTRPYRPRIFRRISRVPGDGRQLLSEFYAHRNQDHRQRRACGAEGEALNLVIHLTEPRKNQDWGVHPRCPKVTQDFVSVDVW